MLACDDLYGGGRLCHSPMHSSNLAILLLQIAAILGLSRVMGSLFRWMRLPQVVGEMAAGIMLGPTLLGLAAPQAFAYLFPPESLGYLNSLSQLGVVFFLFLIGLELDPKLLMSQGKAAMTIGVSSIVVPFAMGVGLTYWLAGNSDLFSNEENFHATLLFMGTAIAVTAFPVLARILTDTGLQKSRVGTMSIAAAAANDVVAWCVLAMVVAYAQAKGLRQGLVTAGLTVLYIGAMFYIVRPFLRRLEGVYDRNSRPTSGLIALVFLLILLSAVTTELIGIHALFGAFMLGAIMPRGTRFVASIAEKIEDFTVVFLLPVFFAYAGIQTYINFGEGNGFWFYTLLVIAVACIGKVAGASVAAKGCGLTMRESLSVGVLMNTRGLMELVILNVGRELGVINDRVYAIMVVMALATTAMTAPLLQLVYPRRLRGLKPEGKSPGFSILIPLSMPRSAAPLAELADMLTESADRPRKVVGLYLRPQHDFDILRSHVDDKPADQYEPLHRLQEEATRRELPIEVVSFVTRDPGMDIAAIANARAVDMILMGFHKPLISHSVLGGTVHRVMSGARCDVGVFVDRGLHGVHTVLVPYLGSSHDRLALEVAGQIGRSAKAKVTVLHVVEPGRPAKIKPGAEEAVGKTHHDPSQPEPVVFKVVEDVSPVDAVIREAAAYDLVVIGVAEEWGLESGVFGIRGERIAHETATSMLIVRRGDEVGQSKFPVRILR